MTKTYTIEQIRAVLPGIDILRSIGSGFVAYSKGKVIVPPRGEMVFKDPPGDVHIKYGYITGDEFYVIKVADLTGVAGISRSPRSYSTL